MPDSNRLRARARPPDPHPGQGIQDSGGLKNVPLAGERPGEGTAGSEGRRRRLIGPLPTDAAG